jgi:hypothetical protein
LRFLEEVPHGVQLFPISRAWFREASSPARRNAAKAAKAFRFCAPPLDDMALSSSLRTQRCGASVYCFSFQVGTRFPQLLMWLWLLKHPASDLP